MQLAVDWLELKGKNKYFLMGKTNDFFLEIN